MKQLSMTDAFMLAVENERQRLQMASVSILAPPAPGESPVTRQRLRDLVAERIHLAPALRHKLRHVPLGLDYPYWIDDADLDLDHHVREFTLPEPGNNRQLAEAAAELVSQPLDHSRPLWELHVIDGLRAGRVAVLFKLHHAAVDGISGLELHTLIFDRSPEGREVPPPALPPGEPMPSTWQMLARGVASLPFQPVRAVLGGARAVPYLDQLMPFRVTPGAGTISGAARSMARLARLGGDSMLLQGDSLRPPTTVLDRPVTGRRRWAFRRVPLDDAKRIKNHFGVTLNDVVVAATAGAIRSWLLELGELPAAPLVALVPISVRTGSEDSGGNLVQVMLVKLPTNEADPQARLRRTHEALRAAKERHNAVPATAMRNADELLMPALFIQATRAATLLAGLKGATANAVISNVPGPATEVYLAGSRVEALYPVGGLVEGFGFSTIVFSYSGGLDLGFVVDGDSPADPWRLAEAYDRSQRELLALVPDGLSG